MAQGPVKHLPAELKPGHAVSAPDICVDSADLEFATSVQNVRLRTVEDALSACWKSSAQSSFAASPNQAQLFVDLHRSDRDAGELQLPAMAVLPEVGTELLGFRLLGELGRGAFGRVFLAQQGDLANRAVVLKVSPKMDEEPRTLAQLQHTNIVPVYSVHRAGPLQAVCMPYFGGTTLANVVTALDGRKALPESGKELVSTIVARKSTLQDGDLRSAAGRSSLAQADVSELTPVPAPGVRRGSPDPAATAVASPGDGLSPSLGLLQKFTYVEAVLWIGSSLADGLVHAHERGIVHRDLKPANILLTDDGQPMLLDFNLAEDTKRGELAATANAGGTLPYMGPEQIEACRVETAVVDYRSDIYSLGVVLFQLLTGRLPFPKQTGPVKEVLEKMLKDRQGPAPAVRCWNKAVSPAVESIIRRCLEPDLKRRYQSARQLKEDLDRQLENRPLRYAPDPSPRERLVKWRRRHPRLASTTTMAVLAGLVIAGLSSIVLFRGQRLAEMDARESLSAFLDSKKSVQYLLTARTDDATQIDEGVRLGREALGAYGALDQPVWPDPKTVRHLSAADQSLLQKNAADLLLLLARGVALQALNHSEPEVRQELVAEALHLNQLAESCRSAESASRTLWTQRAELTGLLGRPDEAKKLHAVARSTPLQTASDRYLAAAELAAQGRYRDALPLLTEVTEADPQDFWAWFLRGVCHDHLTQGTEAVACYSTCIALAPRSPWAHMNRGLTHLRQQSYKQAAADLDQVITLRPDLVEAYKHRALARQGLSKYSEAIEDLTRALELGATPTHVYFLRAAVRERAGDPEGAKQDRADGLRRPPTDEMGWLTRGYARMNADPRAALDDFDQALKINGRSLAALQNKAHILGKLGRNDEAVRVLDKAVETYPDFIPARAGRGVLLARLGKRDAAHKDATECLARDNKPLTLYQLAGIYALTSQKNPDDRPHAFRLLSVSLQKGVGFDYLETDRDLDPIRNCAEFQRLVDAARAIRSTMTAANAKSW